MPSSICIKIICPFNSGGSNRPAHGYTQTEHSSQDEILFMAQTN